MILSNRPWQCMLTLQSLLFRPAAPEVAKTLSDLSRLFKLTFKSGEHLHKCRNIRKKNSFHHNLELQWCLQIHLHAVRSIRQTDEREFSSSDGSVVMIDWIEECALYIVDISAMYHSNVCFCTSVSYWLIKYMTVLRDGKNTAFQSQVCTTVNLTLYLHYTVTLIQRQK